MQKATPLTTFSASQERVSDKLEFTKLWLFDNAIGDAGAAALAELVHPRLLEVHLSHNSITTLGESSGGWVSHLGGQVSLRGWASQSTEGEAG